MARKAQEARQRKKLERQAASEAAKAQKKAKGLETFVYLFIYSIVASRFN